MNSQTHTLKDRVSLCSHKVDVAQGRSKLFEGGMAKVYAYRHCIVIISVDMNVYDFAIHVYIQNLWPCGIIFHSVWSETLICLLYVLSTFDS